MTTDSLATPGLAPTPPATALQARPYARSWLNRVNDGLDSLPGPAWIAYAAATFIVLAVVAVQGWWAGLVPTGTIGAYETNAFWLVYPILMIRFLDGAARRAWRSFRTVTDVGDEEAARIEYELTVVPARPAVLVIAIAAFLMLVSAVSDPVGSGLGGEDLGPAVMQLVAEIVSVGAMLIFFLNVARQLRLVTRLHALAVRIDLFAPQPLRSFSVLSAETGLAILGLALYGNLIGSAADTATTTGQIYFAIQLVALTLAVLAFVLPLRGLHQRMVAQKHALLGTVNGSLETTTTALHASVADLEAAAPRSAGTSVADLQRHQVLADTLNKSLSSVLQERDVVSRLSTWPWDPTTFRAFASAIALPIALWLVTRLLEHVV